MNHLTLASWPLAALLWLACVGGGPRAFAGSTVEFTEDPNKAAGAAAKSSDEDSPAWHRDLWTGSFDEAADASGAAAKQLQGLEFGECKRYLQDHDDKKASTKAYWACVRAKKASAEYAKDARSIQKQQEVMSVVSKASDVAAVGAVAGVAYAEIAVKQGSQADTYSSAANIQKTAAQLSYVTGAADFSMGAFAYVAQKKKLEQMKSTITGSEGGVKASSDPAVTNALTNAVEAAKKAAYNHMMWGAGKLAAGYGMMYVAKKSQQQAANMGEIQADKDVIAALQAQQAQQVAGATSPTPGAPGSAAGGAAPFYQNNNPTFTIPGNTAQGASSPASNSASNGGTGSSTGGSSPLAGLTSSPAAAARSPASSGGLLGSSSASSAPGSEGTKSESATDPGQQKAAKEAIGNSFEMQLTGGMHAFAGGGSSASGGKDDVPNIASLMGSMGETKTAGTGLSPNALFAAGTEGTDGREQGSMSGVSAKSEISLFDITKAKITKMFEVGNVGIPKDVQVKN